MLRSVEIQGLRAIRYANVGVNGFQVLVGANASGKSAFLDALSLVKDVLTVGIERALRGDARNEIVPRAANPRDLLWMRAPGPLEIALTFELPESIRDQLEGRFATARYEVGLDLLADELSFAAECLYLCPAEREAVETSTTTFPAAPHAPSSSIVHVPAVGIPGGWRPVVFKGLHNTIATFVSERGVGRNEFRLGPERSALANLPEDDEQFPAALWVRRTIIDGVHRVQLNAEKMRQPAPVGLPKGVLPDGSNLPWVVQELERDPPAFERWLQHVKTALPDIVRVEVREREDDRARYLVVTYENGLTAPSWLLSDGTLRMLALTLLAYAPLPPQLLLIEEPENGVHPRAIQAVVQSLQSVYDGQVFVATHSPLVLAQVDDEDLLCFAKDDDGAVAIVRGDEHPRLAAWRSGLSLGDLLAGGILG